MRVSEYFNLQRTQAYLDFVDVRLDTDIAVFVDPTALKAQVSPWAQKCKALVQGYFESVLICIKKGDNESARKLLSCLNERNEFHLGYSKGASRGHAFGNKSAETVWGALSKSRASTSGLLKDLEDTALMIDKIGRDMISDAVCNIIRSPLIEYTQDICRFYGIPLNPDVDSGPIWDSHKKQWEHRYVELPVAYEKRLILVPKISVRHKLSYDFSDYYTHFLLPVMQQEEIAAMTGLVRLLKDGTPKVTKKSLRQKYGSTKSSVVEQTLKRPHVLAKYKAKQADSPPPPLSHSTFAKIEGQSTPNWNRLIDELSAINAGKDHAGKYEDLIERILSAVFYPSLCNPTKQDVIHSGRKRIDITYLNEAKAGFFYWLSLHYPSAFIMVECKNYAGEIGNPELDQLSSRFSPNRGKVGILVCRKIVNVKRIEQLCLNSSHDDRGYILTLTDEEIVKIIEHAKTGKQDFPILREKFNALVKH